MVHQNHQSFQVIHRDVEVLHGTIPLRVFSQQRCLSVCTNKKQTNNPAFNQTQNVFLVVVFVAVVSLIFIIECLFCFVLFEVTSSLEIGTEGCTMFPIRLIFL